jgi:hypothetical protein
MSHRESLAEADDDVSRAILIEVDDDGIEG